MSKCAMDRGTKCIALTTHECETCAFRKTKDELLAGRRRARILLERLPDEQRKTIEDKYYGRNNVRHEI